MSYQPGQSLSSSSSSSSSSSLSDIPALLSTWYGNFKRNTASAFDRMQPRDYIRLVAVIGAYLLLRPYLIKLGIRIQAQQHEKASNESVGAADLRSGRQKVEIPGVESSDEEEEEEDDDDDDDDELAQLQSGGTASRGKKGEWGRTARLRQRRLVREAFEAKERMLNEESDEDIKDFLVD